MGCCFFPPCRQLCQNSAAVTEELSIFARWRRRLVTCPLTLLLFIVWWAASPVMYVAGAVIDLFRPGHWTTVRGVAFIAWWLLCEAFGIVFLSLAGAFRLPGYEARIYRVQSRWMELMLRGFCTSWSVDLSIEGAELARTGPAHVLCRHASLIDTVFVGNLLANPHGLHLRYVFKKELLNDPTIDIYGNYVPNLFVDRHAADPAAEIAAIGQLGENCGPLDGVVLYPEGTLFTQRRLAHVLSRLKERNDPLYAQASALRHVLPPHLGGALALLETNTDMIFFAHAGLDGAPYIKDYMAGRVTGRKVRAKIWRVPADEIPTDRQDRIDWLYDQWTKMDRWIEDALALLQQ